MKTFFTAAFAAGASILVSGCLGTGTKRIDAPCREMSSAVAWEMLKDSPTIPFVDLRPPGEVTEAEGRLPRALEIPLDRLAADVARLERFRETTIVVFGRDRETGRQACQLLTEKGFRYVIFLSDGAEGWFQNGLPRAVPTPTPSEEPAKPRTDE
ncbi:MAG TPA: rhodanese-like domain-containing protein [Thermoanaerobaculia bacterium]|nr:rhodanese-like domain-containing protein [Thermoanaerobaculia bacterium]